MKPNSICFDNMAVLANATELATELAMDVIKNSTVMERDTSVPQATRSEIQNAFVSHLGARLAPQGE